MKKIPIIMDVDTGVDDAMAIILALASEKINLLGITTVAGNVALEHTTRNTRAILELLNHREIPVGKGADRPIFKALRPASITHGQTGLGGAKLKDPTKKVDDLDAVGLMKSLIENSEKKVTLVPVGPLTNIAILLRCYPHLKNNIEKIVLMGGAAYRGNSTLVSEFNIWIDPEAAHMVFSSGVSIVMAGLDVTMKALAKKEDIDEFKKLNTSVGEFCTAALEYYFAFYKSFFKNIGIAGCAIHDAVAIAYLTNPEIMKSQMANVNIDVDGLNTYGATATNFNVFGSKNTPLDVEVLTDVNRDKFVQILLDAVKSYR